MKDKGQLKIGDKYDISQDGSLGLMAMGYKGLMAWRKKIMNIDSADEELIGPLFRGKELKGFAASKKKTDESK